MLKNKILIIAGMHRSGTSLMTQWLNKCGLHVGDDLLEAGTGNDNGHFEDLDFLNSHKALLKSRRLSDNGFTATRLAPLSHEEKDKLRDIIHYKNDFNSQWGWKDPRTCLFLDVYNELIPDAFYFVVLRDYQSVISSLIYRMYKQKVEKYEQKKGFSSFVWKHFIKKNKLQKLKTKYSRRFLQIWIAYNEAILQQVKKCSPEHYFITDYKVLFENGKPVYEHLTSKWGFSLKYVDFGMIYKQGQISIPFSIEPYIKDKSLIEKAMHIEQALKKQSILFSADKNIVTAHAV